MRGTGATAQPVFVSTTALVLRATTRPFALIRRRWRRPVTVALATTSTALSSRRLGCLAGRTIGARRRAPSLGRLRRRAATRPTSIRLLAVCLTIRVVGGWRLALWRRWRYVRRRWTRERPALRLRTRRRLSAGRGGGRRTRAARRLATGRLLRRGLATALARTRRHRQRLLAAVRRRRVAGT